MTTDSTSDPQRHTWKLTLSYDGTDFHGWQVQPGVATIQGTLKEALQRITGEAPLPQGSGRTDAGVHALEQVASFSLMAAIPAENLVRALNRTLPAAIRVLAAEVVADGFHARHDASAKTYEYRILQVRRSAGAICPPFLARYVYACPWLLDADAMQQAADCFAGEHDFVSFAATDPDLATRTVGVEADSAQQPAIRTIFSSRWERQPCEARELLVYRVRGNGFVHHMVRNLVGTMVEVGRGALNATAIPAILAARDRGAAGPTAPARGLFLHSVEYDAAVTSAASASG
ncbi:MAG: tRNA pseudouridine(38-40) synthase TruA [Acidobacteriota bacterium]|nr:tRNA pseudouridine(38-40) synthase TruA [Acidobacteriota bacterium]